MKTPCPTCRKMGLMTVFMLIVMASGAIPTTADENFGVGADVTVEVDRATDDQKIPCETDPIYQIILGFWVGILITLLCASLLRWRRRRTATPCALPGGEMLG